jgi:hypothetical protein
MPLRVVSGSLTALERSLTVEHEVAKPMYWQTYWVREKNGHRRVRTDQLTGEIHVRTICGREIDGLTVTHQRRDKCAQCSRSTQPRRLITIVEVAEWNLLQWRYIDRQLNRDTNQADAVLPAPPVELQMGLGFNV